MLLPDEQLYKILKDNEYASDADLQKAHEYAVQANLPLYEALIEKDILSDDNLGKVIADYLKAPYVKLSDMAIDDRILHIVPEYVARKQRIIAFEHGKKGVKVATSNPQNALILQMISQKAGDTVVPYFATERDLDEAIRLYKKEIQKTFNELLKETVDAAGKSSLKDAPVSKLVDLIIEYAYEDKASDIHVEPQEEDSLVRFRIDGILHDMIKLPHTLHDQVATRIKVLSKLRTDEHLAAQDGKLQFKLEKEVIDIRVSIVPVVEGEKIVMRLLSSHSRQFSLSDIGMSDKDLEKVKEGFNKPYGMVLSTGPTGSGKTTSIYSILKIINTREKNIATIEDPVEYQIEGINQIQVNPKTNLTFADGLRAILRQDPNVIFVGEIRDDETASIAVNSALTGHLVLSTLHTNDSATALPRLIEMGIEPFLVSSTVNAIVAQRLVRKICEKCKVSYTETTEEITRHLQPELVQKIFGAVKEVRLYKGKGCPVCHHTGYVGRVGIFEVLEMSPALEELINKKSDSDDIKAQAIKEGMTTMLEDGLDKVQRGVTSIEEIMRATKE
jgi:type II secretory ATPase GspE/PulE/Tfp pilus assembly ATPase PilB-like protein